MWLRFWEFSEYRRGEESSGSEEEEYLPETEDETGVSSAYDETPVKEAQERPREAQTHAPIPKR